MGKMYADDLFARLNTCLDDSLLEEAKDTDTGLSAVLKIFIEYLESGEIKIRFDDFGRPAATDKGITASLDEITFEIDPVEQGGGPIVNIPLEQLPPILEDSTFEIDPIESGGPIVSIPRDQFPRHVYQPDTALKGEDTIRLDPIEQGGGPIVSIPLDQLPPVLEDPIIVIDPMEQGGPVVDTPLDQFPGHIHHPDMAPESEARLDSKGLTFAQTGDLFL